MPSCIDPAGSGSPILRIESLGLHFGQRRILNSVSLDVRQGEVVVLLGASGSGKTSLLRCINLLNQPTHGRITIDGATIFHTSPGERMRFGCRLPRLEKSGPKQAWYFSSSICFRI